MKSYTKVGALFALVAATACFAQDAVQMPQMPEMPKPQKEHEWLQQLTGEWENECEVNMPGMSVMKMKSTETARLLGGFWLVAEGKGDMMGTPMQTILTLGYDPEKNKYIGTWVDSVSNYMWKYEGVMDAGGKTLTLSTEGPCPMRGNKIMKFREVLELKSPNQKTFTSSLQEDDGKWTTMVTINSQRKR